MAALIFTSTFDPDEASDRDTFHNYFDMAWWRPIFIFTFVGFSLLIFVVLYSFYKLIGTKRIAFKMKAYSLLSLLFFLSASVFFFLYAVNAKFPFGKLNRLTESFWSIVEYIYFFCIFLPLFFIQPFT